MICTTLQQHTFMEDLMLVRSNSQQTDIVLKHRHDPSGPITLEQHINRATVLGSLPYASGRQVYWVLVPRSAPGTDEILSSVATIIRTVMLQPDSTSAGDGGEATQVSHEGAFSITHVYTPTHLRRRGYATRMMALLHAKLDVYIPSVDSDRRLYPRGILSFLYSGVGDFYSRCGQGWHIQTSTETYWSTESVLKDIPEHYSDLLHLTEDDFHVVASVDVRAMESELITRAAEGKPRAFAVVPTGDEFMWLVARSKFYGKILAPHALPSKWGVKTGESSGNWAHPEDYAVWFVDYVKKELQFLRLRCSTPESFRSVVYAAALVAKEQECERISAWNVDEGLLQSCLQDDRITRPRTKNLAAVAWYGRMGCPEWIASEKYGWC